MFRANDIDRELLSRLTNDDLKDIGIASLGHRKKLLEAIAELGSAPAAALALPSVMPALIPATVAPSPLRSKPSASAAISQLCSAIWWVRPALRRGSMPRSGATWLELISM